MSRPKWKINFKILPLHYDAAALYGVVFLRDYRLKLHIDNSHSLKYRVSFKACQEKSEASDFFWTCRGELSFVLLHSVLARKTKRKVYYIEK